MQSPDYRELLNALLQVQSVEEQVALAQQHPELLSEEFLRYAQQQVDQMNPQEAITLIERLLLLAAIIHASVQADAPVSQPADAFDIPTTSDDPRAAWVRPFRQFIALGGRDRAPLQPALQHAQQAGEREIAALIALLAQGEIVAAAEQAQRLFVSLHQQGRLEEAYSLLLLPILGQASLVEQFRQFPLEQQRAALQAGVQACEQGYHLSRALRDEPCQALFLAVKGMGLYKARQLEAALAAHEEALGLYRSLAAARPAVYAPDLARTLTNKGNALQELRRYEAALAAYEEAEGLYRSLAAAQPEVYTSNLAWTLTNKGAALYRLRRYEAALAAHQEAEGLYRSLAAAQPEVYERDVAMTLNNLGAALQELRRYEAAVAAYEEAEGLFRSLAAAQPEVYTSNLAGTLTNKGNALRELRRYAAALAAYEEAEWLYRLLEAAQPGVYAPDLAWTLTNKGNALSELRRYAAALAAYEEAEGLYRLLKAAQPEVYTSDLVRTLTNKGNALRELRRYAAALAAYEEALEICNRHDVPHEKVRTLANLGRLYIGERRYEDALPYLREAADLVERLRAEGLSPARRRQIMDEHLHIYENLLICLMKLELYDEALAVAERGKSRLLLIDLLTAQELRPKNAPEPLQRRYEELLFRARAIADELERPDPPDLPPDARETRRAQLRQEHQQVSRELDKVIADIRRADPNFLPAAQPLTREQIVQLAQEAQTTILSLRVTEEGSYAFLVYPDGSREAVVIPDFTLAQLEELAVAGWAVDYYTDRDGWRQRMEARLSALYRELLSPVHQRLRAKLGAGVHPLLIVPNRALALLPLHACWWDEDGRRRYLMDEFVIRYAPSLTLFQILWARERGRRELLLAVANPTGDLPFAEYECEQIEACWGWARAQVLWREQGTRHAVLENAASAHLLHFACHGVYDLANPLESPLLLANGETLTLGAMLEQLNLPHAQLVALSACETALTDPEELADEHFGLALGPLYAGAPTVWGTLWAVADVATGLLMGKAYELLQAGSRQGGGVARGAAVAARPDSGGSAGDT
jgi:CHAT domain-containing protein/tetratricopeptide (TPR) repeat protein